MHNNRIKPNKYLGSKTLAAYHIFAFIAILSISCKKSVDIPPPQSSTTSSSVFTTTNLAIEEVTGIYSGLINSGGLKFSSGACSIYCGMSADELLPFDQILEDGFAQFSNNTLVAINGILYGNFWYPAYKVIYQANAAIEGLSAYTGVEDSVKSELIGESKFIRGLCYFYLTNLFGDVPLVTTTNWNKTNLLSKTPSDQVYQQILQDLIDAEKILPADYSVGNGQRIRANKYAAEALLARVYLYMKNWKQAEIESSLVIANTNLFSLEQDPSKVFLTTSREAILQIQQSNTVPPYNATPEADLLIPYQSNIPFAYITNNLLNSFESGDLRKSNWLDSGLYNGATYYYPYKYKVGLSQEKYGNPYSEYYMVLRLGEQYLIRSEARAQQSDLAGSESDINIIRSRALLSGISNLSKDDLLDTIAHERQIELFCEWGHRWFDLKRTGKSSTVLRPIKPNWNDHAQLYPIPVTELANDPNLTQNPSY